MRIHRGYIQPEMKYRDCCDQRAEAASQSMHVGPRHISSLSTVKYEDFDFSPKQHVSSFIQYSKY
jgi:hypothetical protein